MRQDTKFEPALNIPEKSQLTFSGPNCFLLSVCCLGSQPSESNRLLVSKIYLSTLVILSK